MINRNFKDFKFQHKRNQNQILFTSKKVKGNNQILNLIDNFLNEKNSFVFESVEKGVIRGRYTIFGRKPDKIWEFNGKNSYTVDKFNKKKKIEGDPKKNIEKIIEDFKFKTPKSLPPICSLISGYFSYSSMAISRTSNQSILSINDPLKPYLYCIWVALFQSPR